MAPSLALALLLASAGSAESLLALEAPLLRPATAPSAMAGRLPAPHPDLGVASAPSCVDDVCAPRVSVPGHEPTYSLRGKRTQLVLTLLDRSHVEPLATIAWTVAATGLRLDYTPAVMDGSGLSSGHGGWGHLQVLVRWRLDARNAPVFPLRSR